MTYKKIADFALVIIVLAFLAGVLGSMILYDSGVQFPEWVGVGKTSSALEGRNYTKKPQPTLETLANGQFQTQAEDYLSDVVPMREYVVFANATMQRTCVAAANMCFGFGCFPTLLESNTLYSPASSALLERPQKFTDSTVADLEFFGRGLALVASKYPDKRFLVFVVDCSMTSPSNPALSLSGESWSTSLTVDIFENCLNGVNNVIVETVQYDSIDEYYENYFKTDIHWNILGASRAYNRIAERLSLMRIDPLPLVSIDGPRFVGYYGRDGRFPLEDDIFDTSFDFSKLTVIDNDGNATDEAQTHSRYYTSSQESKKWAFHDLYYSRGLSPMIKGPGAKSAVLISDSYGFALGNLLAMNYENLYTDTDLHANKSDQELRLSSRIDRDNVDDIIFVARTNNYASMQRRMPEYFEY